MPTPPPIQPGTRDDYLALSHHHYRPGHPATFTRTLVIHDASPSPTDRFLRREPRPRPIAVLVESLPTLSCAARDLALGGRYAGLAVRGRAAMLNREVRCISRVIVDPRHRGRGLAGRLVRHALATATTPVTEALAAMGHASPFFARAGMDRVDRPPHERDERLLAALGEAHLDSALLAMPAVMQQRIDALDPTSRHFIDRELIHWFRTGIGRGRRGPIDPTCCLAAASTRLLSQPIYYVSIRQSDPGFTTEIAEGTEQGSKAVRQV